MFKYLQDKEFLFKLDNLKNKKKYLKMTMLTFDEKPIMDIEGRALSGNISCNGNSAIRRTCSFTMGLRLEESSSPTSIENYVSIDKKFKLYIGYANPFLEYKHYGDIIWFDLGLYVINDYNLSYNSSGVKVSISAQDKMCCLNGTIGGMIPASTILHEKYIYNEDETITIQQPTLVEIIREVVNHFGGEDLNKILINDLEDKVKVLMEYKGDTPIWFTDDYSDFTFSESQPSDNKYKHEYMYGDTIGYRWEDFTYPGELIVSAGETVVSILDKIKSVLGNFEYFYDLNGNFIFQQIRNYLNTSFTYITELDSETYFKYFSESIVEYSFNSSQLLTSISNNPSISNIKNDFIVWGTRTTSSGTDVGIRYHLVIDKKPDIVLYSGEDSSMINVLDWREMIYRQLKEDIKQGTSSSDYHHYEAEMVSEWRNLYCPYTERNESVFVTAEEAEIALSWKNEWERLFTSEWTGWNPLVFSSPQNLNYYLDFIDDSSEIGKYSVNKIGRRTEIINDSNVISIYNIETPDIIFMNNDKVNSDEYKNLINKGYKIVLIKDEQEELFSISSQGKSCYDVIRELLHTTLSLSSSISLQTIPIYYLQPNTLIEVKEPAANVYGNYVIQSYSLPLNYNGTMSISAVQAQIRV